MTTTALDIARGFGQALDRDDFKAAATFLAPSCRYQLSPEETFSGPEAICSSYEQNMQAGREKFDELRWGECEVSEVDAGRVDVHYVDYLRHNGVEHVYQCKQRLTVEGDAIVFIEHINLPGEREKLKAFLAEVGLE